MARASETTVAYIGLGSNLGDRRANIENALSTLASQPGITVDCQSELIETAPVGGPAYQPMYLNAAARLTTTLSPYALLHALQRIETRLGRQRTVHNGPRTVDLDLLLFGEWILEAPELTIPHPRMHVRRFVMQPLAEIAPHVAHPVLRRSIVDLLGML